jgi:hypothetical protein
MKIRNEREISSFLEENFQVFYVEKNTQNSFLMILAVFKAFPRSIFCFPVSFQRTEPSFDFHRLRLFNYVLDFDINSAENLVK